MAHPLFKVLLGVGTAVFWEEVVRPELVVADLEKSTKRRQLSRPLVKWSGPAPDGLPFATGSIGTILLIDAVERSADPLALLAEASRVAQDVHILAPRPWSPAAWLNPKNRWILLGTELHPVPGRRGAPVWLPKDVQVVARHLTPVDTARRLVEDGMRGALG